MAQSLQQIKKRICSIENTEKVTSAMQMVAASKLKGMSGSLAAAAPFFHKMETVFKGLLSDVKEIDNPFIGRRKSNAGKICLCVVSADAGLCGAYNNNIIHAAQEFIRKHGQEKVKLVIIGKKCFNYFKRLPGPEIVRSFTGLNGNYSEAAAQEIAQALVQMYLSGSVDEVYVAYTHFVTALVHMPVTDKFLNLEPAEGQAHDYIYEPDKKSILEELVPAYISAKFRLMLQESFTAEHASRTVAMKMATENARHMLQSLILLRNKVRQAKITEEMLEIISSAEALKA